MKVGYARLSVGDPEGLTLQIQIDRLQAGGCMRIYQEVISGNARHRPEWEALKQAISDGQVSEVVALRMDRLSRSWTAIGEVIDLFSQPDAPRLTLLDEPSMDLNSIGGRTVAGVLASVAAGERERIVARSTAGMRKRHAVGKRHKLAFGLMADPEGYPILDRRPWLSTISDKRTWSRAEVAQHLWAAWETAPTRYSAKRTAAESFGLASFQGGSASVWACNPSLRGALTGGKRDRYGGYPSVQENAFEPLVSPQRHLAAVATFLRERSTNTTKRTDKATPLSGKVICAACGYKMQLHRLLSRPGHAWTFRCRREGCEQHDRRFKYSELVEHCRQHLLARQPQVLQSLLSAITPPAVDVELDRRIKEVETQVTELRGIVAKRPSPGLQRELQAAETELADLQLAAATPAAPMVPPEELLRIMAPIFEGNYELRTRADGQTTIEVPLPIETTTPEQAIRALLTPEGFDRELAMAVPQFIHSLRVQASSGVVEVIDLLDGPPAPLDLDLAQQIGRGMILDLP
jgi:DNA invertase Pin-like site-specific DNA recombinase